MGSGTRRGRKGCGKALFPPSIFDGRRIFIESLYCHPFPIHQSLGQARHAVVMTIQASLVPDLHPHHHLSTTRPQLGVPAEHHRGAPKGAPKGVPFSLPHSCNTLNVCEAEVWALQIRLHSSLNPHPRPLGVSHGGMMNRQHVRKIWRRIRLGNLTRKPPQGPVMGGRGGTRTT